MKVDQERFRASELYDLEVALMSRIRELEETHDSLHGAGMGKFSPVFSDLILTNQRLLAKVKGTMGCSKSAQAAQ